MEYSCVHGCLFLVEAIDALICLRRLALLISFFCYFLVFSFLLLLKMGINQNTAFSIQLDKL